MDSYHSFADYYDILTNNVDYAARGNYFANLLKEYAPEAHLLLDLACGTGSLTYALADLGYDMIGVDGSPEMLMQAMMKQESNDVLFLLQPMEELELHGPVDAVICALDSINHLSSQEAVAQTFRQVAHYTKSGGVFLFDVNTLYKHENILAENAFVFETDDVFCVWQNHLDSQTKGVEIVLDFFVEEEDGRFIRSEEHFTEQYYSPEILKTLLEQAGFALTAVFHEDSRDTPKETSQRLVYVAHRQ